MLCETGDFLYFFLDNLELLNMLKTSNLFFNPVCNNIITCDEKEEKNTTWQIQRLSLIDLWTNFGTSSHKNFVSPINKSLLISQII